jgi:glutathione S-transferase
VATPRLFISSVSPTCKRVLLVVTHKGIDHERIEVDISTAERSEEFRKVSPRRRKVPVMEHDGKSLLESTVINEYLEEVFPEVPMLPKDPAERAYARAWIRFADSHVQDLDAAMVHEIRDLDGKRAACRKILENLAQLDEEMAQREGFFLGPEPSLVDAAFIPTLRLVPVWSRILSDTTWEGYANLKGYLDRAAEHPAFERAVFDTPDSVYDGFFGAVLGQGMTFP